jgi:hypothetical protein
MSFIEHPIGRVLREGWSLMPYGLGRLSTVRRLYSGWYDRTCKCKNCGRRMPRSEMHKEPGWVFTVPKSVTTDSTGIPYAGSRLVGSMPYPLSVSSKFPFHNVPGAAHTFAYMLF